MNVIALVWLIVGVLFAAGELLVGEFTLLMLAGAAFGTAAVTAIFGDVPYWGQGVIFALLAVAMVLGVRPLLKKKFTSTVKERTYLESLPGRVAVVTKSFSGASHSGLTHAAPDLTGDPGVSHSGEGTGQLGQIKLDGDYWTAQAHMGVGDFEVGENVIIVQIEGNTALVAKEQNS